MLKLVSGNCGCLRLYDSDKGVDIAVIDSNLLSSPTGIYALRLDNKVYVINREFNSKSALVLFLNTTFAIAVGIAGNFYLKDNAIYYSNFEHYIESEIMSIYKNEMRCYVVGTPASPSNEPNKHIYSGPNGSTIGAIVASITDVEVLGVFYGTSYYQNRTNLYNEPVTNDEVMVLTQQRPATQTNTTFEYILPFPLS